MNWKSLKTDPLEALTKSVAAALGCLYGIGLLATALRLAQLGVLSVEFAKPLYVLTGAWACLPLAIGFVTCVIYSRVRKQCASVNNAITRLIGTRVAAVLVALSTSFLFFVGQIWMIDYARVYVTRHFLGLLGFTEAFLSWLIVLAISSLLGICFAHWYRWLSQKEKRGLNVPVVILCFPVVAVYIVGFAFGLYLTIPVPLGGGMTRIFAIVVNAPEIRKTIVGKEVMESQLVSPVLAETADYYVLPAPSMLTEKYWLNPMEGDTLWESLRSQNQEVMYYGSNARSNFVLLPKSAVAVATVLGVQVTRFDRKPDAPEADQAIGPWGKKWRKMRAKERETASPTTPFPSPQP